MNGSPGAPVWVAHHRISDWTCPPPPREAAAFHRGLDGYAPTRLVDLPDLAVELGVGRVLAKDESARLGLPAFKALGASWAVHRALAERPGSGTLTMIAATDGNHGRAVARFARLHGHRASIFIPRGVHPVAVQAIAAEGAEVTPIDGSYEDAVAAAARAADRTDTVLIQDTAWDGYHQIPRWIVDGYDTLFAELDDQLGDAGIARPDLVIVPVGVGSLLHAALAHYRSAPAATAVVSVEPNVAACLPPSLAAGHPVTITTGTTIMAGLNCGSPSTLAWPYIVNGLDAATAVADADVIAAAHRLAMLGVPAGPCGAASLAAARAVLTGPGSAERADHLGVGADSAVVLLVTEGSATNPVPVA